MTESSKTYRYKYKCKSCKKYTRTLNHFCASCGLTNGSIVTDEPGINHFVTCSKCRKKITPKIIPSHCPSCQKEKLNWWNLKSKRWFVSNLKPSFINEDQTLWLKGDFDGDLIGDYDTNHRHEGSSKGSRSFNAYLLKGILRNVEAIDSPPIQTLKSETVVPLRQDQLKNVVVETNSSFASVSLYDFRLHNWVEIHDDELIGDKIYNRIRGTAYGCVNPSESQMKSLDTEKLTTQIPKPQTSPSSDPPPTIQKQQNKTSENKSPQNASNGNTFRTNTSSIDVLQKCLFCETLPKLLIALIVFIICNLFTALTAFFGIGIICYLDSYKFSQKFKITNESVHNIFAILLIAVSAYFLVQLSDNINELGCVKLFNQETFIIFLCFALSALLIKCLPKAILCAIWIVSLLLACTVKDTSCIAHQRLSQHISTLAHNPQTILNNISNKDEASEQQNTSEQRSKENQLTLSEILDKPDLLNDCQNKLYLPFAFDSSILNQYSEETLNDLKVALDKVEDNRRLVITGHSDSHGDETSQGFVHNIQLSERRATAVAEWLANHGSKFNQDAIDVRGVGSKFPLNQNNLLSPFNRRVEIQLSCPAENK
jgi:outer membrane protein OmpA-like peptidoglycan-associated protein